MRSRTQSILALLISSICFSALFSQAAWAETEEQKIKELRKVIKAAQAQCPKLNCQSSPLSLRAVSGSISKKLKISLDPLAQDLSQAWGDSILEGDIEQKSEASVGKVFEILKGTKVIGYRFTYSAAATDWSACPTSQVEPLSKACEGKISESGFAPKDLTGAFVDPHDMAKFEK